MGLIWFVVHVNPEWMFILYVMWEAFCTCKATACFSKRQFWGLDDQGIIHQFLAGKSFISFSKHSDNFWGQPSPLFNLCSGPGSNHLPVSSARVKNVCSYTLTVFCLMKHGDSFTTYEVFSRYWVVLLAAQTVVWTVGGGLPFEIMHMFTGNSKKMPFQMMKDGHVVIFWELKRLHIEQENQGRSLSCRL
jgi:hypothetical protein